MPHNTIGSRVGSCTVRRFVLHSESNNQGNHDER